MHDQPPPSFDEWVDYCFTKGYADFGCRERSPEYEAAEKREQRFCWLNPVILAEYVVRLFESPALIADRYTDDQIGEATWFLFGIASGYFQELWSEEVSIGRQIRCMKVVATMYTDLFDRVCCFRGTDPDRRFELPVDSAVYMIWDMDCIEGAVMFPERTPHLVDPGFWVLEKVLSKCRTSSCLQSALHGLGHLQTYHPERVEQIIMGFLNKRHVPKWIRDYAEQARTGYVL